MEAGPLIPRSILFGNPDRARARLSPDGQRIAYLAPVDGVLNVWIAPVDDPSNARAVTEDRTRGVRSYEWACDDEHILHVQDTGGDENWHVLVTNLETGETRDATPMDGVAAMIIHVSRSRPGEILVGLNDRDPQLHDVYCVNLATCERTLVYENEGFVGFVADDSFALRVAVRATPRGGLEFLRRKGPDAQWEVFERVPPDDALSTSPIGFDAEGRILYMCDSVGRDTAAWVAIDTETGTRSVLAEDRRADAVRATIDPVDGRVQAVGFDFDRVRWRVVDQKIAADFDVLRAACQGDLDIVSRSDDDLRWIVADQLDDGPTRYYLYDRKLRDVRFLFSNWSDLEDLDLAPMHPLVLRARDGLDLVSYLTLPLWADPDRTGRPSSKLPLVLLVHGGPWARDSWGYHPYHQWLSNRGYAVLSVNFRGSTGLGKHFTNAGDGEWAGRMHDDLLDAVDWAVAEGVAEADRVAIMGGSYGGYATLVGLTFTPEVFACGVDIVGPSNLVTLMESFPPYWAPMKAVFQRRVGDPATEAGHARLVARSPLSHADKICRPLLIAQGANDPRVKQAESDQIVSAMKAKGIPVAYALYPDEGHGFVRPVNRMSFHAITEQFLAAHLGGRAEPIGDALEGSTLELREGTEQIPGLS